MSKQQYPVTNIPSFIEGVRHMVMMLEADRDAILTEIEEGNDRVSYVNQSKLELLDSFIKYGNNAIKKYKDLKPKGK